MLSKEIGVLHQIFELNVYRSQNRSKMTFYLTQAVPCGEVEPGAMAAVQSFGDYQNLQ
jgi:hypothetical protein